MKTTKKEIYLKVEYYSREITDIKPSFHTIFRIYYDSLKLISKVLYHVSENPWHPNNDHSYDIFQSINECFEQLEIIRLKSKGL